MTGGNHRPDRALLTRSVPHAESRFAGTAGLTLVEVVLAVGILAFVLLTVAALQGSSLQVTAETAATRASVRLAENEIELQRLSPSSTCTTTMPEGFSCTVDVLPCTQAAGAIACTAATDPSSATSSAVRVTIVDARGNDVTLTRWIP